MIRPSWTDYYLGLALVVARRSHDIHTQHGCIITDKNNKVLGMGYNGFPANLEDDKLPLNRPDKYQWMIHSERNAIDNCTLKPIDGIAYVTGQCCNDCIMHLYRNGIKRVVMMNHHGSQLLNDESKKIFNTFIEMASKQGFSIEYVDPDLSWLRQFLGVNNNIETNKDYLK
jgi:dCMP deaminase